MVETNHKRGLFVALPVGIWRPLCQMLGKMALPWAALVKFFLVPV